MSSRNKLQKQRKILNAKRATRKKRNQSIIQRLNKTVKRGKKNYKRYKRQSALNTLRKENETMNKKRDKELQEFEEDSIALLNSIDKQSIEEKEEEPIIIKPIQMSQINRAISTRKKRKALLDKVNTGRKKGAKIVGKIKFGSEPIKGGRRRRKKTRKKRGKGTVQSRKKRTAKLPDKYYTKGNRANTLKKQAPRKPIKQFKIKRQLSDIDEQRDPERNKGIDYASLRPPQSLSSKPKARTEKRSRAPLHDSWKYDVNNMSYLEGKGFSGSICKTYKYSIPYSIIKDKQFLQVFETKANKSMFVQPDFNQRVFQTYLLRELIMIYTHLTQRASATKSQNNYLELDAISKKYWGYIIDVLNMDEILLPINEYSNRSLKYYFITSPIPRSLYLLDTLSNIKANPYIKRKSFEWNGTKSILDFLIHIRKIMYNPGNMKVNPIIDPLIRVITKLLSPGILREKKNKYRNVFHIIDDIDSKPSAPLAPGNLPSAPAPHIMPKVPLKTFHTRKKGGRRKKRRKTKKRKKRRK